MRADERRGRGEVGDDGVDGTALQSSKSLPSSGRHLSVLHVLEAYGGAFKPRVVVSTPGGVAGGEKEELSNRIKIP